MPPALDPFAGFDFGERSLHPLLIEIRLLLGQGTEHRHFLFVGQVGGNVAIGFQATQDEGLDERSQGLQGRAIPIALDWHGEPTLEEVLRPQITGVEKVNNRPQFRQPVFHRGAGECNPEWNRCGGVLWIRFCGQFHQAAHRLGLLGVGIFDVLGFVQDNAAPGHLLQGHFIAEHQGIANNRHVHIGGGAGQGFAPQALAAVVQDCVEGGAKAGDFPLPVAQHRGGTHQQHGAVQVAAFFQV